jgi:hypothetical protein
MEGQHGHPLGVFALFSGGFVAAWVYWSFAIPRWRRWARRRGAPAEELQRLAVEANLVWPKGSIFEKTEFRVHDEAHQAEMGDPRKFEGNPPR